MGLDGGIGLGRGWGMGLSFGEEKEDGWEGRDLALWPKHIPAVLIPFLGCGSI
jgi:hypothetical protein